MSLIMLNWDLLMLLLVKPFNIFAHEDFCIAMVFSILKNET